MSIQLKNLIENLKLPEVNYKRDESEDTPKLSLEQKRKLSEMVSKFNEYGKAIYRETDISEISKNLSEIVNLAESYALNDCGDWFEENTVKRNMSELKKYNEMFNKVATELKSKQHQMEALFEDMGRIIDRYFGIS